MILLDASTSSIGQTSFISIGMFLLFVGITMMITYWAAKKTKTTSEFYAAGRSITGFYALVPVSISRACGRQRAFYIGHDCRYCLRAIFDACAFFTNQA